MKAVILVGGKGTRLLPLTCNLPKAMLPVLNRPFLEYVIRHLGRHGVNEIVLAQGHLAQPIKGYLGDGSQLGVRLHYVVEEGPLGTAGAIKSAEEYLDGTFLALNGDIFTDLDITAMVDFHRKNGAVATIALTPVDDPTRYGVIEADKQGKVARFLEKPSRDEVTTNMINAGTYVLEPEVLAQIPSGANVSIEYQTFPRLLEQGRPVYACDSSAYWIDVGTPETYFKLNKDLLGGESRYAPKEKVLVGEGSDIHPTARITGPVVIGAGCSIGPGVRLTGPVVIGDGGTILEGSLVEQSIIWRNARLGPRASLKNSILADHCRCEADSQCHDSVLGDNVTVLSNCQLEPGSKIWPDTTVEART